MDERDGRAFNLGGASEGRGSMGPNAGSFPFRPAGATLEKECDGPCGSAVPGEVGSPPLFRFHDVGGPLESVTTASSCTSVTADAPSSGAARDLARNAAKGEHANKLRATTLIRAHTGHKVTVQVYYR